MRLIDADVQVKYFEGLARSLANAECFAAADTTQCAAETLRIAPTIDAEPVRHGRWEGWHDDYMRRDGKMQHFHYYECSECCRRTAVKSNYCPHCGAKMDLEVQDD